RSDRPGEDGGVGPPGLPPRRDARSPDAERLAHLVRDDPAQRELSSMARKGERLVSGHLDSIVRPRSAIGDRPPGPEELELAERAAPAQKWRHLAFLGAAGQDSSDDALGNPARPARRAVPRGSSAGPHGLVVPR